MRTGLLALALAGCVVVGGVVEQDEQNATTLRQSLPYYGQDAPSWCEEDMACWIGTTADDRSDDELIRDMAGDIAAANSLYGFDTLRP